MKEENSPEELNSTYRSTTHEFPGINRSFPSSGGVSHIFSNKETELKRELAPSRWCKSGAGSMKSMQLD